MRNQQLKDPKIVALIHNVRSHSILYDYRLAGHRNEALKDEIWSQIARTCALKSANDAKQYWKNLHYSFTVFYRNELLRLVRANYDEQTIGSMPAIADVADDGSMGGGQRPWGYYSDMRFIAPFRVKGIDPQLDRLIELAKPIVCSEASYKLTAIERVAGDNVIGTVTEAETSMITDNITATTKLPIVKPATSVATTTTVSSSTTTVSSSSTTSSTTTVSSSPTTTTTSVPKIITNDVQQSELIYGMNIPPINYEDLTVDDACLRSFFDSLYRSARALPTTLQRTVKQQMLMIINNAEAAAETETETEAETEKLEINKLNLKY